MHYGVAISPGVVVAPALCLPCLPEAGSQGPVNTADRPLELERLQNAVEGVARSLKNLVEKTAKEIGERESMIFRAHLVMLRDRSFLHKVRTLISESGFDAASALRQAMADYEELFSKLSDEYLRERIVDLRDVVARIQEQLKSHDPVTLPVFDEPMILVTDELLPSQTLGIDRLKIVGIIAERGGATGHAAIIARSMGIPAVSGIPNICEKIKTGDIIALDGREGCVIINPGPEAESAFRKLEREFFDLKDYLIENRDHEAVTADGIAVELLANINNLSDATAAKEVGAEGVGLFRTEYLFLTHPSIPSEDDQFEVYSNVRQKGPAGVLTIRTLDLGGDKTVPYLGSHRESNPFMGWRSIRLSFAHPDFFRQQLRAILRVGQLGKVRLMFPMITHVEELRRANRMVWRAKNELEQQGITLSQEVEVGFMLEVPAAAVALDQLIMHADFVCIGTNDLIQYLMAADRNNPKVAHLCDPLMPAVIRLLHSAIEVCHSAGKPVCLCGEMAGRPRAILLLLAMGLRSFSMSPAFVPLVKELIHSVRLSDLQQLASDCLKKKTATQVRAVLHEVLESLSPRIAMIESARS